jgi:surface antigen
MIRTGIALVMTVCVLTSCSTLQQTPPPGTKTLIGGAGGAAAGGLLASQLSHGNGVLTAAGTLLGGLTGAALGSLLDTKDRQTLRQVIQQAPTAPVGTVSPWGDPRTGQSGEIIWEQWHPQPQGLCRQYRLEAVIDGQRAVVTGCAVRRADGTWELQREK